jgi:hypothetical protein
MGMERQKVVVWAVEVEEKRMEFSTAIGYFGRPQWLDL